MAIPTLSMRVSRRAMLAGAAATPVLVLSLNPLPGSVPLPANVAGPDARLFRRIAVARTLRKDYARAQRLRERLRDVRDARSRHSDRPFQSRRVRWGPLGLDDLDGWLRHSELFRAYGDAVRAAVDVPAQTVAGVHAKLELAVIAARRGPARIYMYEDREWLEAVLVDLERLAHQRRSNTRDLAPRYNSHHPQEALYV